MLVVVIVEEGVVVVVLVVVVVVVVRIDAYMYFSCVDGGTDDAYSGSCGGYISGYIHKNYNTQYSIARVNTQYKN